jgi:phospholipid transport system substrate-binding protein
MSPSEHTWQRPGRRLLFGMAAAVAGMCQGYAQAVGQPDARQPVTDLYATLQTAMRANLSFSQRFDRLAPEIDRAFDLNAILQTSVGLRWAALDEASRGQLFTVFRAFTIASYTANFDKDSGVKFEVLPQERTAGSDIIVESTLIPVGSEPIRIDYLMRGGTEGWRIVDVLLNGSISRVAVQRSDFRSLLASGSPAPLIDSLRQKVSELSDGTMRP